MEKENLQVPQTFVCCLAENCMVKNECLRHCAVEGLADEVETVSAFTPRQIHPADGKACPRFRSAEPVKMARGFMNALGTVPTANVKSVMAAVSELTNQSYYYRLRRGQYTMSPEMQTKIADILVSNGASAPIVFDEYSESYDWE